MLGAIQYGGGTQPDLWRQRIGKSPLVALAGAAESPSLEGFELAGSDHKFMPARAMIVSDQVVVRSASVPHPEAVRYAWAAFPSPTPKLYNQADLPASPFSTRPEWISR